MKQALLQPLPVTKTYEEKIMKKIRLWLTMAILVASAASVTLFAQTGVIIIQPTRWVPSENHCSILCCLINGTPIYATGTKIDCPSGQLPSCTLKACDANCSTVSPPCPTGSTGTEGPDESDGSVGVEP